MAAARNVGGVQRKKQVLERGVGRLSVPSANLNTDPGQCFRRPDNGFRLQGLLCAQLRADNQRLLSKFKTGVPSVEHAAVW